MTRPKSDPGTKQRKNALAGHRAVEKLKKIVEIEDGKLADLGEEGLERARDVHRLLYKGIFKRSEKAVEICKTV